MEEKQKREKVMWYGIQTVIFLIHKRNCLNKILSLQAEKLAAILEQEEKVICSISFEFKIFLLWVNSSVASPTI